MLSKNGNFGVKPFCLLAWLFNSVHTTEVPTLQYTIKGTKTQPRKKAQLGIIREIAGNVFLLPPWCQRSHTYKCYVFTFIQTSFLVFYIIGAVWIWRCVPPFSCPISDGTQCPSSRPQQQPSEFENVENLSPSNKYCLAAVKIRR